MATPIVAFFDEEEILSVLSEEAGACFKAWRTLGRDPKQALEEVERAGLWVNEARKSRHLRRPVAFYQRRLGNRFGPAEGCNRDLALGGRVLASWQMLSVAEVNWLRAVVDGKTLSSELTVADATEILAINEASAKELAKWQAARLATAKANRERPGPLSDDDRACDRYWWRDEPVSYWTARWKG